MPREKPLQKSSPRLVFAASERCADLLYLSGFMAPDPFLWLETADEKLVVASPLEVARARKVCFPGVTVLSTGEAQARFGLSADSGAPSTAETVAAFCRTCGVERIVVPPAFPLGLANQLADQGIVAEAEDNFVPARACKSAAEVGKIKAGVRLAEAGLARALDILRQARVDGAGERLLWRDEPLTAETLRGEIAAEIARRGGTASHTIVAPGRQGADPHEAGFGPIAPNQPIVIDIFPRVDATGYHGDLTRTVVKGVASEVVRRAFATVQAARDRARERIRPGVDLALPHRVACEIIAQNGFQTDAKAAIPHGFFHGLGHGLGLEVHEAPRVSDRAEGVFATGHVVTVEPGLYYPEWGGVRLEDVVVVTDDGTYTLTEASTFLEI